MSKASEWAQNNASLEGNPGAHKVGAFCLSVAPDGRLVLTYLDHGEARSVVTEPRDAIVIGKWLLGTFGETEQ